MPPNTLRNFRKAKSHISIPRTFLNRSQIGKRSSFLHTTQENFHLKLNVIDDMEAEYGHNLKTSFELKHAILGKDIARTGAISSAHHKGMHTTTFSEMYPLGSLGVEEVRRLEDDSESPRSWIIDTPGIKGFGLLDVEKEEICHYFREIFRISRECRYSNCLHTGEAGCAVDQAVVNGEIALSRYESYLSILDDTNEGKYR